MKKFAKLSLVAAMAVAGVSASAQPLAEAIKNVDVSGTMVYRYDDRSLDDTAASTFSNSTHNSYKIAVNLKSKINDDLTANTRTVIGSGNGMAVLHTESADGEAGFALTQANFAYTGIANTTIIAGKQAVPSPFAVQADAAGDEDTGTGITAIVNAGAVTVAGTYLNQTNLITGGNDIAGLGVMASVGPVGLDAWYLKVLESSAMNDDHDAYTVGAKAKVAMVSMYGRYSAVAHGASGLDTESLWKVGAKANFGGFGFGVDYGQTNDANVRTTGVNLTGDADAKVNLQGWGLNLNKNDASLLKINVNTKVAGFGLSANYNLQEVGSADNKEYYGQVSQKIGKNFKYYVRLGQTKPDAGADGTRGRVHVQYSF